MYVYMYNNNNVDKLILITNGSPVKFDNNMHQGFSGNVSVIELSLSRNVTHLMGFAKIPQRQQQYMQQTTQTHNKPCRQTKDNTLFLCLPYER